MRRAGFTLLEILIVTGITMIIVGAGYVFSVSYMRRAQIQGAASILSAEVREAQTDAYFQLDDAAHGVKLFTDHVVRFEGTSYATRVTSKDVTTSFPATLTIGAQSEIVFPNGSVEPSATATLTVSNTTYAFDISISSYGVIALASRTIGS